MHFLSFSPGALVVMVLIDGSVKLNHYLGFELQKRSKTIPS